jgi:hypothetical protein
MHSTTTVHPTASATMHLRLSPAIDEVIGDEGAGSEAGKEAVEEELTQYMNTMVVVV